MVNDTTDTYPRRMGDRVRGAEYANPIEPPDDTECFSFFSVIPFMLGWLVFLLVVLTAPYWWGAWR